jgi:ATP-dependent Clp protease ATP-binding subunit ClpC
MPDQFTAGARQAIQRACLEARRFRHRCVDVEHLALGMIADGTAPAVILLGHLGVPLLTVRDDLERVLTARGGPAESGFTAGARRVFALAAQEARELGHRRIGIEDVLLGVMRDGQSMAARILGEFLGGPRSRIPAPLVDLLTRSRRWSPPGASVATASAPGS